MTLTQLYLFTVILPNFHSFSSSPIWMIPLLLLIGSVIAYCISVAMELDGEEKMAKALRPMGSRGIFWSVNAILFLSLGSVLSPDEKQIYTIAGGYVATNTKDVAKLPDNIVKAANSWLEKAAALADDKPKEKK